MTFPRYVRPLLVFLVLLDAVLVAVTWFMPEQWWSIMHGAPPVADPFHMLRRLGTIWFAFFLLQLVALFRFEQAPQWLAVIAGVRLTEMFADGVYWAGAPSLTWFGTQGLLSSPPSNILFGYLLLRAYRQAVGAKSLL
jgi:hypothetical protein